MHFGEFLRANIIEGLEDAYLDYKFLVHIVEGSKGDDDQLRIGSTPMPLSTGGPSVHKQAKRLVSSVLTRIALFVIFLRSTIARLCGYCICCKGDGAGAGREGVDPNSLNEPLVVPCESIKIIQGEDSLLGERHEEFLCAMHGELARCNDFLASKEAELEASIDSLVSTIEAFMGNEVGGKPGTSSYSPVQQSPRPSFEGGFDSPERPGEQRRRHQAARGRSQSESDKRDLPPLPPTKGGGRAGAEAAAAAAAAAAVAGPGQISAEEGGEVTPPTLSPNVSPRSSFRVSPRSSMISIESRGRALSADAYSELSQLHLHSPSRRNSDAHPSSAGRHMSRYTPTPLFQAIWSQPDTIEHAYRELHVHIMQLKQVATVNLTGFQKAAKKCKKNTLTAIKTNFSEEICCKSSKMDELADKLAKSYAKHFTNNNVAKARATLMIYKGSVQPSLKVGFFLGIDVALTLCLIWVTMYQPAKEDCPYCVSSLIEVIPVYRVIFFPILFIWGWSALVYLWRSFGINYLWILDMDPKTELGIQGSASLAATMTSFCLLSLLLYTAAVKTGFSFLQLPLYVWPLTLFLVTFLACIAPPGAFYYKSRKWFFQTLAIIAQRVVAFFGPEVRFRENYVADVLTSMVAWIVDFENTIIYYAAGHGFHPGDSSNHPKHVLTAHILTGIPYYYRVQECIRRYLDTQDKWQLVNCGKYLTSLSAICISSIGNYVQLDGHWSAGKMVWFTMLIISTLYCYVWDVSCDWGFITRKGLRKNIGLTGHKWFYIFACITNFIGRIGWAFTITPYSIIPGLGHETTKTIAGTVEILRRCQWTLLRVEYEYMDNPNKYRSIKQVPILLTFESEAEQIHPMRAAIIAGANLLIVVIVVIVATIHFHSIKEN